MRFISYMLLSALSACSSVGSICERAAMCGGGRDAEIEACEIEIEAAASVSGVYECDGLFSDYLDCLDQFGACDGDRLAGCDDVRERWDDCVDDRMAGEARVRL